MNEKILIISRGCGTQTPLRAMIKKCIEYNEQFEIAKVKIKTENTHNELQDKLKQIYSIEEPPSLSSVLDELCDFYDDRQCSDSIPDLKKKIKHSKNPMEKKMLEKQLNELYKERKRR